MFRFDKILFLIVALLIIAGAIYGFTLWLKIITAIAATALLLSVGINLFKLKKENNNE